MHCLLPVIIQAAMLPSFVDFSSKVGAVYAALDAFDIATFGIVKH